MLSLLDALNDRDHQDLAALTSLVNSVLYKPGFLNVFVRDQAAEYGKPFLIKRATLSALLVIAKFDQWQNADWLNLKNPNAEGGEPALCIDIPTGNAMNCLLESSNSNKWLRIVDLGMEKSGFSVWNGPRSLQAIDQQIFKMDSALVVDFLRSARYMSWSEDEWGSPESLQAMRQILNK